MPALSNNRFIKSQIWFTHFWPAGSRKCIYIHPTWTRSHLRRVIDTLRQPSPEILSCELLILFSLLAVRSHRQRKPECECDCHRYANCRKITKRACERCSWSAKERGAQVRKRWAWRCEREALTGVR